MARMHTRKKGRSGSEKPTARTAPTWVAMDKQEVIDLVLKLSRGGLSPASIGRVLRDSHGVPSVRNLTGKTVTQILAENNSAPAYPSDLVDLIRRALRLRRHLRTNKQDRHNDTVLRRTESKIKRLGNYYRGHKLPAGWKYDPEQASLLVK